MCHIMLLVLYVIQIYKSDEDMSEYGVDIWIDNKEVLSMGEKATMGIDM